MPSLSIRKHDESSTLYHTSVFPENCLCTLIAISWLALIKHKPSISKTSFKT